jgi:hypothetical protein
MKLTQTSIPGGYNAQGAWKVTASVPAFYCADSGTIRIFDQLTDKSTQFCPSNALFDRRAFVKVMHRRHVFIGRTGGADVLFSFKQAPM